MRKMAYATESGLSQAAFDARNSAQGKEAGYYGEYSPIFPNPVICFVELFYAYKDVFIQK